MASSSAADDMSGLDEYFSSIEANDLTGCFERLVCDITANPTDFNKDSWILEAVTWGLESATEAKAKEVLDALSRAADYGDTNRELGMDKEAAIEMCEQRYQQCTASGLEIHDQLLKQNLTTQE